MLVVEEMVAVAAAGGPGPGWQVARWQRGGSVVAVASLPRLCQKSGVSEITSIVALAEHIWY